MHNERQGHGANTSEFIASHRRQQEKVNAYFRSQSSYWKEVYASGGVAGKVYRERQAAALAWIESLVLMPGSRVLEIGCGAGFLAVALAQRGLCVKAIDSAEAMVWLARRRAAGSGTADLLSLAVGDVSALTFEDGCFDLVIAIGVIPWLEQPELAIQEMARVIRPGGHVILTADNRAGLVVLLDPWYNPALRPLRLLVKGARARLRPHLPSPGAPEATFHSHRFIDEALASAGLVKTSGKTLGFGPFTVLYHRVLPEALGLPLHQWLQRLADRGVPVLRSTGVSYLVRARKLDSLPLEQSTSATEEAVSTARSQHQPSKGPLTEGSRASIGLGVGEGMHDERQVHGANTSEFIASHRRQ